MSIIYLDTSALIKRYVQEPGSEALGAIWRSFTTFGSSVVIHVEIAAALSKARRMGWLNSSDSERAWEAFLKDWGNLTLVNVSTPVVTQASALSWEYGLRGYDAIHLASALIWQEGMGENILMCTFDRQMWSAATQLKMSVWPENLDIFAK